jgi:hypothetical protein
MNVVYIRESALLSATADALREKHADDLMVLVGRATARLFGLGFLPYSIATMPTGYPVAVVPRRYDPVRSAITVNELRELVIAAKAAA